MDAKDQHDLALLLLGFRLGHVSADEVMDWAERQNYLSYLQGKNDGMREGNVVLKTLLEDD